MKTNTLKTVRIYDNGGETFDRYTAVYMTEPEGRGLYGARGMSENPTHSQGFGQYCAAMPGRHLGRRISFSALPEPCRELVQRDIGGGA
jgi:hypothetical protein